MARKASTCGEKVGPRQLTQRELQDLNRYLQAAGGWRELSRQLKESRKNRRPRGRPSNDISDALVESLADGGPMLRRPQIRAKAEDLWMGLSWFNPLSEPVQATRPRRETPIKIWDPHCLAVNCDAFTAQVESKLRREKELRKKKLRKRIKAR